MRDSLNLLRLRKIKNFHLIKFPYLVTKIHCGKKRAETPPHFKINLKALKFYAKENLFARVQLQSCISSSGANFHENGITQIF